MIDKILYSWKNISNAFKTCFFKVCDFWNIYGFMPFNVKILSISAASCQTADSAKSVHTAVVPKLKDLK